MADVEDSDAERRRAADRARKHRELARRAQGFLVTKPLAINAEWISRLVDLGFLTWETSEDIAALSAALEQFLEHARAGRFTSSAK